MPGEFLYNGIVVGRPHLSDGQVAAYNAFNGRGYNVYVPMLFRQYYGNESALYIQNLTTTSTPANDTITFNDEKSGFYCTMNMVVQPGASTTIWLASLDNMVCVRNL